ncbi:MAG TPA: metal ABC transporter substrate-binding protein [Anaerolineales bacterium]|jgi:ABC-type Zn uptake system ZnuABC Zn-binding protein ZnuA|nr:zinc ABC transporter substrate-binding protein [Anaerolineales bacterium]HNQ93048.1 metal ABC transporter substrate-binding protein [Anaerolineales bacterium]HNS61347.1 metal ABC transporter substrate-binding protein [Anaerolineales bacterium]
MARHLINLIVIATTLSACGGTPASSPSEVASPASTESQLEALATTSMLADIAQHVAGERIRIESILPIGADPHSYQYTPQDATKVADAKLLILFDYETYETFLEPLLLTAGGNAEFVFAGVGVGKKIDVDKGGFDPHIWLDPNNIIVCVENIREGLTHFDPAGAAEFKSNADAYVAELQALDAWIVEQVDQIPAENRLLVTNHESLGYFAERYGFTIVGSVLESFSSGASPSAQQLAALIDQVKASNAPAIFLDAGDNPALAEQIADETGVRVVPDLHLESLTDGAPAATYIDMMKYNVTQIVDALK